MQIVLKKTEANHNRTKAVLLARL